jgi:AcrR family transcriptional regulator
MSGNRRDRRALRTRRALVEALSHLVLQRRLRRIRVADIVAQARVGRSTFYEYYRGADALLLEALERPLAPLADAAAGRGDRDRLAFVLAHFWENRMRARDTLAGRLGGRVARRLAEMVEARLGDGELALPRRLAAHQLAAAMLAPLRGWLHAEAPCEAPALAQALCRSGEALVRALSMDLSAREPVR